MERININFTDFWVGFVKDNNYFFNLLSKYYVVSISDDPEILFYSCYGNEYLKYNCIRIFFSAENLRPDFSGCDFAITFDFINRKNHYRLPLYVIYIGQKYFSGSLSKNLEQLTEIKSPDIIAAEWASKKKFCCMVVSNSKSKKRIHFFQRLSKLKHVDSGGKVFNNVGGLVKDKLKFIRDYKFVISFENSSYPGYVTEKILEPLSMGCIPIYWGNPLIEKDFNKNRFLNYNDFDTEEDLIKRIMEIDGNDAEALRILTEPIFTDNKVPAFIDEKNVIAFLNSIINNRKNIKPIAASLGKKQLHFIRRKKNLLQQIILSKTGRNFT